MAEINLKQGLIEKVESNLNKLNCTYDFDETYSVFSTELPLMCKLKNTHMLIICRDDGVSFRFSVSMNTDDENVIQVMEYVTRVNDTLLDGGFRMDLDRNTIEYSIFLPCEDVPTHNAIERNMSIGLKVLHKYGDELLAVMFGMKNAKDAVEAAEEKSK